MSENTDTTAEDDENSHSGQDTKDRLDEFNSAIDRIRDESDTEDDDSCGC